MTHPAPHSPLERGESGARRYWPCLEEALFKWWLFVVFCAFLAWVFGNDLPVGTVSAC